MRAVTLKRDADNLVSFVCPADVDPDKARRAVADVRPYYCVPSEILPLVSLPERRRTAAISTSRCCYGWPRSSRRWPDRDLTEPGDRRAAPLASAPRRLVKHPRSMHYKRPARLILPINGAYAATSWPLSTPSLAHASLADLALAVLIRQQYVINVLFRLATSAVASSPSRRRRTPTPAKPR